MSEALVELFQSITYAGDVRPEAATASEDDLAIEADEEEEEPEDG